MYILVDFLLFLNFNSIFFLFSMILFNITFVIDIAIGFICAVVLVAASIIMAVKEDERIPKVRECLPGANCGACGYAGCDGYAKALAAGTAKK